MIIMTNKDFLRQNLVNDEQLDHVSGGTLDLNKYDEIYYNQAGMRTEYCIIDKDKFFIKNREGKEFPITYKQANWAVEYWQKNNKQATYEIVVKNCKN